MPNGPQRESCSPGCGQQSGVPLPSSDGAGSLIVCLSSFKKKEKQKLNLFLHQVLASWTEDLLWTWCVQRQRGPRSPVLHDRSHDHLLFNSSGYHHLVLPCSVAGYQISKWKAAGFSLLKDRLVCRVSHCVLLSITGCHATEGIRIHPESWERSVQDGGCHDFGILCVLGTVHLLCLFCCGQPGICLPSSGCCHACVLCQERHHLQSNYLRLHEPTGGHGCHTRCTFMFENAVVLLNMSPVVAMAVPRLHYEALWQRSGWWLWSIYIEDRGFLCGSCINLHVLSFVNKGRNTMICTVHINCLFFFFLVNIAFRQRQKQ